MVNRDSTEDETHAAVIARLRKEYRLHEGILETDLLALPSDQFRKWFEEASRAELEEPNKMTLATVSKDGTPSARMVLLKQFDKSGFVFFTNYESRKGSELMENPRCALVFYWSEFERQVRVEGSVEKVSTEESSAYFQSRPIGARLSAIASSQSRVVASREEMEKLYAQTEQQYKGKEPPCPKHWGGFRVKPVRFEFWQGRENRLHDRIEYILDGEAWKIQRLSP